MSWRPKIAFQLKRVRVLAALFTVANLVFAGVAAVVDGKSGGAAGLVTMFALYLLVSPLLFAFYSLFFFYWAWVVWLVGKLAAGLRGVLPLGGAALDLVAAMCRGLSSWMLAPVKLTPTPGAPAPRAR